jgi:hypothetical protein
LLPSVFAFRLPPGHEFSIWILSAGGGTVNESPLPMAFIGAIVPVLPARRLFSKKNPAASASGRQGHASTIFIGKS